MESNSQLGSARPRSGGHRSASALAAPLRQIASSAAEQAGGGVAMLFVLGSPEGPAHLRAAAGFAVPQAAREAALALQGSLQQALSRGQVERLPCPPGLAERAAGELLVCPLRIEDRLHGALAVGSRSPLAAPQRDALERLAEVAALRLDHARLRELVEEIRRQSQPGAEVEGDQSEEVLRLSEALFAQDIELLRKDEKLGKIEKLKNDFIEKMSRELRTPLNGIIEAVIAVLTGEDGRLSEEAKTGLRRALDDGTAFLRTLQNILDLWRIKQGELPVEITDVNFREVLDEALFSIQDAAEETSLEIVKELQDPFPKLRTDLAKLNQILFLLLDNAVKFTPGGRIEVRARIEGERLCCEVRDSGIGICPDDQQFIFDEFFQVDDTRSSRYGGSGLGLTLVRDLIVLLEGEVGVSSDVGRGTSVSFAIPVQRAG